VNFLGVQTSEKKLIYGQDIKKRKKPYILWYKNFLPIQIQLLDIKNTKTPKIGSPTLQVTFLARLRFNNIN
jgi:hypothetical protein